MSTTLISLCATVLYLSSALLIGIKLFTARGDRQLPALCNKSWILAIAAGGAILHGIALSDGLFAQPGFNLGFTNAVSLIMLMVSSLLVLASIGKPLENLGIVIFPSAALAMIVEMLIPSGHVVSAVVSRELKFHILISILAYSVLSIAAVQACLVAIQDHHLRHRQPGGFIRSLPPLQTMETLMFQLIGVGFILHSLSLITGFLYLENMFAQHMVHKTILSITAWLVFGTLIVGRIRRGWRGQTAIRWTLAGFVVLFLAYFGSKLVLEFVVGGA